MALAAPAPRQQVGANALSQFLVQLVLVELPVVRQRFLRCRRHLLERVARGKSLLDSETLDLLAELCAKLTVVAGDQGTSVEGEVAGSECMNGATDDVGNDEVAGVDGLVVDVSRDALSPRCQRQQRRVAGKVRGGARRCLGEPAWASAGQPGAGEPEGENLIGVHLT